MRRLILWDMLSLDGYFTGPAGEIDWFVFQDFDDAEDELKKYIVDTQLSAGTLVFGRATYQGMADYWPKVGDDIGAFMNTTPKVVFSTTLDRTDWNNTTLISGNVSEEVAELKEQAGGDIFVFGSADLSATLIQHGLVDEYRIAVNPVILGAGVPFFKGGHGRLHLKLTEVKALTTGLVILHYQPA